jgi:hypothetical protein
VKTWSSVKLAWFGIYFCILPSKSEAAPPSGEAQNGRSLRGRSKSKTGRFLTDEWRCCSYDAPNLPSGATRSVQHKKIKSPVGDVDLIRLGQ